MKKWIILWAWFFTFEHALPDNPSVKARTLIGPFASAAACNDERDWVSEQGARFPGFKATPCVERKAA